MLRICLLVALLPYAAAWSPAVLSLRTNPPKSHVTRVRPHAAISGAERSAIEYLRAEQSQQRDDSKFDYWRAWYPVAVVEDLELDCPTRIELLGDAIALWRDHEQQWRATIDRCPHRWAPMSEGLIDPQTGHLTCSYHGWAFRGDGTCAHIPQASDATAAATAAATAQASRRACLQTLPTQVNSGLLWVFPDGSKDGILASHTIQPVVIDELNDPKQYPGSWYVRDQPYSWDTLIENLADPAHLPFAHHGIIGARQSGGPLTIGIENADTMRENSFSHTDKGFMSQRFAFMKFLEKTPNMRVVFEAPCLAYYQSEFTDIWLNMVKMQPKPWLQKKLAVAQAERDAKKGVPLRSYFVGYAVPTKPGHSRIITKTTKNFGNPPNLSVKAAVSWLSRRNNRANAHLQQHLVLDGDNVLLHFEEREVRRGGAMETGSVESHFYLPTPADAPVRAFRKWLATAGGKGPFNQKRDTAYNKTASTVAVNSGDSCRETLLDRYNSHTKHCSACRNALAAAQKMRKACLVASAVLFAVAAVCKGGTVSSVLPAILALCSLVLSSKYKQYAQQFVFVDYVHAKRDV